MTWIVASHAHVVTKFVRACIRGDVDAAGDCLSASFGMQDGRKRLDWLFHEIREHGLRDDAFDLDGTARIEAVPGVDGLFTFAVLTGRGDHAYMDSVRMDGNGLIAGNGRAFEAVSKLAFERGKPVRRGIALRTPGAEVLSIRPEGAVPLDPVFRPGANFDEDGFHSYSFALDGDDSLGRSMTFRLILDRDGRKERVSAPIWMRGTDFPGFGDGLHPDISRIWVTVPDGPLRYWSLVAMDEATGMRQVVSHPERGESYSFLFHPTSAILTDALDNDWIAHGGAT